MPLNIFSCWKSSSKISENEKSNCEKDQQQNAPKEVASDIISRGKNNYLPKAALNTKSRVKRYTAFLLPTTKISGSVNSPPPSSS